MNLLDHDEIDGTSLRNVIENMRQVGLLSEALGRLFTLPDGDKDSFDQDFVVDVMGEAGSLMQMLGEQALKLLDAQAAPVVPTPADKPRKRTDRALGVAAGPKSSRARTARRRAA